MIYWAFDHVVGNLTEWNIHREDCAGVDKATAHGFRVSDDAPREQVLHQLSKKLAGPGMHAYTVHMGCLTYDDHHCTESIYHRKEGKGRKINPRRGNAPIIGVEAPQVVAERPASSGRVDHSHCTHDHTAAARKACRQGRL